jgi:hypothetical protein
VGLRVALKPASCDQATDAGALAKSSFPACVSQLALCGSKLNLRKRIVDRKLRLDCKRLTFCIFEQSKREDGSTMEVMWRVLIWSLAALFAGVWPSESWDGKPWPQGSAEALLAGRELANGHFGVVFLLKGDWDFFCKAFGLRHYSSNEPCDHCRCSKDGPVASWPNNFNENALWKQNLIPPSTWRRAYGNNLHELFKQFAFLSNANVEPDEMHTIHMGTSTYFLGSVLWLLTHQLMQGSAAENMQTIWGEVVDLYREQRSATQYSNLGVSSFIDPEKANSSYPKLKGRAAEVKSLAPVLRAIWHRRKRANVQLDDWVGKCLDALCAIHGILDEEPGAFFLAPDRVAALRRAIDQHLAFYSRLAAACDQQGLLLFTVAPKHHALWHIGHRSAMLHPRRGACYMDEDFVRRLKGIVQMCTAGTPLHRVPAMVLQKYRWGMFYQNLRAAEE